MAERGGGAGGEEGWGCCSASSGLLLPAALAPHGGPRAGCAVRPGRPYRCGQPRAGAPAGAVPPCCPQITRPPAPPRPRAPPGSSRSLPAAAATRAPKGCGATEATDPVTDTAPPARGSWKDCRSNR